MGVIGGILVDPTTLNVVAQNLVANDFYVEANQIIYEAMVALSNVGQPIDMITLGNILRDQGKLERVGGNVYLASIIDATPTTANIKHHARIVNKKAMVRRAVLVAQEVISAGYNGADVDDAIGHYLKTAERLRAIRRDEAQVHTLADVMVDVEEQYERTKRGEFGVPFPWQTMTNMTLGLWPGTLTFFVARPGCGKCIHEDAEIIDPISGVPLTMRQVVEGGDGVGGVTTWSKDRGVHFREIDNKIDSGVRSCVKVMTRTGREIILTPEHPLLTPGGWRRTDSLGVGASIAIPSKMEFPRFCERILSDEVVDLLAVLLTEGTYTGHHTGFSTTDNAIVTIMERAAHVCGVDLKFRGKCGYDFVRRDFSSHPVNELLRKHGMWRKKAVDKTIPDVVYRLNEEQLARFISIFWMCDGYMSDGAPEIVLASEKMIRQIQSLLLRFGVQSRVSYKPVKYEGSIRNSWRLRVVSMSFQAFYDSFSLWGKKHDALEKRVFGKRNPNVGSPRLPEDMIEWIKAISKAGSGQWRGGLHEKVAEGLGRSQFQTRDLFSKSGTLKLTAFKGWCKVYGVEDEFKWLWSSDIFWDEIEHVEEVGDKKVYDLTVRPTSCFVANDIIVHNSWTAVFIAWNAWLKGYKILIVSPEMTRAELGERVVARHGKLHYGNLVAGELGMFGEQKFYETTKELRGTDSNRFIIIDDEDRLEPAFIEHVIDDEKPDVILVDSVYMMRVADGGVRTGPGSKGGRYDRILATVDWLRTTARRTMIPVVGISQLAREGAKLKKGQKKKIKKGQSTGGLEGSLAMTDTILWDVNNLFAMYQDDDMVLHKQMLYVPLKVRRRAQISGVVTTWDMETMNFDEVGTHIETDDDFDDPNFSSEVPF